MNLLRYLPTYVLLLVSSAYAAEPSEFFGGIDNEAYLDWFGGTSYERHSWLGSTSDSTQGVAVHWTIEDTYIQLAVAGKASGWLGFGLAEAGGMLGADIVLFSAESNELVDSYVLDTPITPMVDTCQSWTLVNSVTKDGFTVFEARRLLDTGDSQDRVIIDDSSELVPTTRVIAAWGDSSTPSYHGLANRAKGTIRFMGAISGDEVMSFQKSVTSEAEGNFTIGAKDHELQAVETAYDYFCFSSADLAAMEVPIAEDLHIIGIEPVLDSRATKYVHHFIVYGMNDAWNSSLNCMEYPGFEILYVWAPGSQPMDLPSEVGTPLGLSGYKSFRVEIHYHNPELDTGIIDSSGVRFYFTSKKRQFDMGVYSTADVAVRLYNRTVSNNTALSGHTFDCPSGCSSMFLKESVTVVLEHLHMHKTGRSMVNHQIRDNQIIRSGEVQFWDFDQQGDIGVVQQPFTIEPGDSFQTTCRYSSENGEVFGRGSSDEMCIAFLFYYPRQIMTTDFGELPYMCSFQTFEGELSACNTAWTQTDLKDESELQRSFGVEPPTCPSLPPANVPSSSPNTSPSSAPAPTSSSVGLVFHWLVFHLVIGGLVAHSGVF